MSFNGDPKVWRQVVQRMIKTEMSKRGVRYQALSSKLAELGVVQSPDNLRNKVNKGILGADLLLQIMYALEVSKISREDVEDILASLDS